MKLKKHEQNTARPMCALICAWKESGGLDDKFGGGNVITETLAGAVVTSAMLSFPSSFQVVGDGGERITVAYRF